MDLIRGRSYKKYINCIEDKRDYDFSRYGFCFQREHLATEYCQKNNIPDITDSEKEEIAEFYANYGIKILNYDWHRMYYHVTRKS